MKPFLLGLLLLACSRPEDAGDRLERNRLKWKAIKPPAFAYTVQRICECEEKDSGPFAVLAGRDSVPSVKRVEYTGDTIEVGERRQAYSIDSFFAETRKLMGTRYDTLLLEFDPTYGFPGFVKAFMLDQ